MVEEQREHQLNGAERQSTGFEGQKASNKRKIKDKMSENWLIHFLLIITSYI